jgi:hypothetical protein
MVGLRFPQSECVVQSRTLRGTAGAVTSDFRCSAALDANVNDRRQFKLPAVKSPQQGADRAALGVWRSNVIAALQRVVDNDVAQPIERLLDISRST